MSGKLLFWGSGSIPCWKPMLVLAEKGIDYESKQISFSEKGHKGPEVMALNPRGQVYTVVHIEICKAGNNPLNEGYPLIEGLFSCCRKEKQNFYLHIQYIGINFSKRGVFLFSNTH